MIFWFSGTGNSYHAAIKVQERFGGDLVNMAEALRALHLQYEATENERVFFVFPVYFGTLPGPVRSFVEQVQVSGASETVVLMTCGKTAAGADCAFQKAYGKNRKVRAFYDIVMPENCIFYLRPPIREEALMILKHSDRRIKDVLDSIEYHHRMPYHSGFDGRMLTGPGTMAYNRARSTKKFRATDACIGCGTCAEICPAQAITMQDGRPVWTKPNCEKCAGCINRCPVAAIEYGMMTRKRFRYVHPDWADDLKTLKVEQQKD